MSSNITITDETRMAANVLMYIGIISSKANLLKESLRLGADINGSVDDSIAHEPHYRNLPFILVALKTAWSEKGLVILKELLRLGANPNPPGVSLAKHAVDMPSKDYARIFPVLLENKVDLLSEFESQYGVLHYLEKSWPFESLISRMGKLVAFISVVDDAMLADVIEKRDEYGFTILQKVAFHIQTVGVLKSNEKELEILERLFLLLVRRGADIYSTEKEKLSPLDTIRKSHPDLVPEIILASRGNLKKHSQKANILRSA